jgi:hypothetical protein
MATWLIPAFSSSSPLSIAFSTTLSSSLRSSRVSPDALTTTTPPR